MWHKPCRTFHPWCLCIKTRCLSHICLQTDTLCVTLNWITRGSIYSFRGKRTARSKAAEQTAHVYLGTSFGRMDDMSFFKESFQSATENNIQSVNEETNANHLVEDYWKGIIRIKTYSITNFPLDSIVAISQAILSNAFSRMKTYIFFIQISLKFFP